LGCSWAGTLVSERSLDRNLGVLLLEMLWGLMLALSLAGTLGNLLATELGLVLASSLAEEWGLGLAA
jgi:hypothetical protein